MFCSFRGMAFVLSSSFSFYSGGIRWLIFCGFTRFMCFTRFTRFAFREDSLN